MFDFEKNCSVVISESLKARFCKDINVPIKIFTEPYFEHFMRLYDKQFNTIALYKSFVLTVEALGGEAGYFQEYGLVKDRAITFLNESEAMQFFSKKENFEQFKVDKAFENIGRKNVYNRNNVGKFLVSIDMVKGNFTALRHYNPDIVGDKETYQDFMRMFTDYKHFVDSKYIRQVIFGNINPSRQVTYEKFLMSRVLTELLKSGILLEDVISLYNDEIVFEIRKDILEDEGTLNAFLEDVNEVVKRMWAENITVRMECYKLLKFNELDVFVKEFFWNKMGYEFKCADYLRYPLVIRSMNKEPLQEMDKYVLIDGYIAKIEDSRYNSGLTLTERCDG